MSTYFYIETYDDWGDRNYYVFAESEDEAKAKLKEHWDGTEKYIHKVYGPYKLHAGLVLEAGQ